MNRQKKIILFLCNWSPHAAFLSLQDDKREIPDEVRMVRVPCSGRVDRSLVMKAFAMGADGVALVGCAAGTCRYGSGTTTSLRNTDDNSRIIDLMGIGQDRLRFASFLPEQADDLLEFLQSFLNDIKDLGPTPVTALAEEAVKMKDIVLPKDEVAALVAKHEIHACQDCGKCSSACPLALVGKPFSARGIATSVINKELYKKNVQENVWSCLTCGLCYQRCPSSVNFPAFIKDLRSLYRKNTIPGHQAHAGFLQSLMRSMASPDMVPQRWRDMPEELQTDDESKVLFTEDVHRTSISFSANT